MKRGFGIALKLIVTIVAVNMLGACANNRNRLHNTQSAQNGMGGSMPTGGSSSSMTGTSTSGGGNGVQGKIFEAYIVDPRKLPAYREILKPLFENVKDKGPDPQSLADVFKIKTWYIAPVKLNKINKSALGVSFMKSGVQQIAAQTMGEVWISQQFFNKMNLYDQAYTLTHELVESLYLFQFMKMSDFCKISVIINGGKNNDLCTNPPPYLDEMMPAVPFRPLNVRDYDNIRFVTGWLLEHAKKPLSMDDLDNVLYYKGFDKRFFHPLGLDHSKQPADMKISASKFFNVLRAAELTNFMPDNCLGLKTKKLLPCKIKVKKATVKIGKFQDPAFDLSFAVQGFAPVKIRTYVGKSVELSASVDTDNKTVYTFSFADMTSHFKIGDRFYSGLILLRNKSHPPSSDMTIDSIIVKPGIVTSIDTSKIQVCHLESPYVANFLDDTILARKGNPGRPSEIEEGLSWIEPFAGCFPNSQFPQ